MVGPLCCTYLWSILSPAPSLLPYRIDLWPGFITSILQYEDNVMLCADVSHKIMRADTVYDYLNDLYQQFGSNPKEFHDRAMKTLVGEIVLTR